MGRWCTYRSGTAKRPVWSGMSTETLSHWSVLAQNSYICVLTFLRMCAFVEFELSFSLHHRRLHSEMSSAHVATRRQSNVTLSPLPSSISTCISWRPAPPQTHTKQTPHIDYAMSLFPLCSVLTLLLTVTPIFSPYFSLCCCSFYCKKHWINSNDLLLF